MFFLLIWNFRSHVSNSEWLHLFNSNETLRYKAKWELHGDVAYRFVQILEEKLNKTIAVRKLCK